MIKYFPAWEDIKQPTCSFANMGLLPREQMQMTKIKQHLAFSLKQSTTLSNYAYLVYERSKFREHTCHTV